MNRSYTVYGRWCALLMAACAGPTSRAAGADERADVLLAKTKAVYRAASSLSASQSTTTIRAGRSTTQTAVLRLRRPNLVHIEITAPQKITLMSDGRNACRLMENNRIVKQTTDQDLREAEVVSGLPGTLFFGHDSYGFGSLSDPNAQKRYTGKEILDGVDYDVVTITVSTPPTHTMKLFIGRDGLVARSQAEVSTQGETVKLTSDWKRQRLDSIPAASFAVTPPNSAGQVQFPADETATNLIAVGKQAPSFSIPAAGGGVVSLADAMRTHTAALLNFWIVDSNACRDELPHVERLYMDLSGKGLEVIAINDRDPTEKIKRAISENKLTFTIGRPRLRSAIFKRYGVHAYPTNYVVDSKGKVVFRCVGFDDAGIKKALAQLGVK